MSKSSFVRLQVFTAPNPADNVSVHAAITLPATGTTVVTTGITNPVNTRTLRLKGNQASTQGLIVTLTGTDFLNQPLTEAVTMGGAFATPTDTVNAFKTLTSITVPTQGASGDTISIGYGAALGLDSLCASWSFDNTKASLITSKTTDLLVISKNTVILAATLDGATDQVIQYLPHLHPGGRLWG